MKITSTVFENNQTIPPKYTCDGENINPPLRFSDIPKEAKSLVLLMDDPDAPKGTWDHWVVFDIAPGTAGFDENSIPPGTQGLNSSGSRKYSGPCPPDREHRYFFKLFALDTTLEFTNPEKVDKKDVVSKMRGHILENAELIGLYERG